MATSASRDSGARLALSQNEAEARWLCYARDVLTRGAGGAMNCCIDGKTDRISRWPGYLGSDYAKGRVLFVGAVHNEQDLNAAPRIDEVRKAAREWIGGERSDAADANYLALLRDVYPGAIDCWCHGSSVFAKFAKISADLGIAFKQQCATGNIAKCSAPSGSSKYSKSISRCPQCFPLTALIALLDPVLVFIACNDPMAWLPGVECTPTRHVYRFQQRNWTEFTTGRRLDAWLSEAADFYRAAMSNANRKIDSV